MYAWVYETGRGFFAEVRGRENRPLTFRDPPHPANREWSYTSTVPLGFLAIANLYSPLRYLVPGNKLRGGAMLDAKYGVLRTPTSTQLGEKRGSLTDSSSPLQCKLEASDNGSWSIANMRLRGLSEGG
jgi:hypothetical protein